MKIRDMRRSHWFRVDNCIIRQYGKYLGAIGIAVYAALCCHADNRTQECFPSKKTIGKLIGCSTSAVRRSLRIMEDLGLLRTEPTLRPDGGQSSNIYYLLDPPVLCDVGVRQSDAGVRQGDVP